MSRLYLHLNAPAGQTRVRDHTIVAQYKQGDTLSSLLTQFRNDYKTQHGLVIPETGVNINNDTGDSLILEDTVMEQVEDRADLFLECSNWDAITTAPKPTPSSSASSSSKPVSHPSGPTSTSSGPTHLSSSPSLTGSSSSSSSGGIVFGPSEIQIFQKLNAAKELFDTRQLRKAGDTYLQVLELIGNKPVHDQLRTSRQICHQQLGIIYLFNKFYDKAAGQFEKAIFQFDSLHPRGTLSVEQTIERGLLLAYFAQAEFGMEDFEGAIDHFEKSLTHLEAGGQKNIKDIRDVKVWLARSLYHMPNQNTKNKGIQIFEKLLKEDDYHVGALTYYSAIALECGQTFQAIPHILRALVTSSNKDGKNPGVDPETAQQAQLLVARVVNEHNGVKHLLKDLQGGASSPSALTFLAQTVKDQGAVLPSIELYEAALKASGIDPKQKANMILNLVHTHEVAYQYQDAFNVAKAYLAEIPDFTIGSHLTVGAFNEVIAGITDLQDPALRSGTSTKCPPYRDLPPIYDAGVSQVTIPETLEEKEAKKKEEAKSQKEKPKPKPSKSEEKGEEPKIREITDEEIAAEAEEKKTKENEPIPFDSTELNTLALMFTICKVLYVQGALQPLPALINLLEPCRINRKLHETLIRNEQAYYSCIAQLCHQIPYPIVAPGSIIKDNVVYVCGDSHCMSTAWQSINVPSRAGPQMLVPKLVTGLKCWHLRENCRFYPKRNFEFAMRTIPNKSTVIFVFGEIDCREGLILAVEKGKYETIEEGIKIAVKVYIKALEEQTKQRQLTTYIHPVIPVLDVTRPVVKQFNQHLRVAVEQSRSLVWLDFFDNLLSADGNSFNSEFALDGTHMSPTYVPLIQSAMQYAKHK